LIETGSYFKIDFDECEDGIEIIDDVTSQNEFVVLEK
jgi:hypothetical protein